MLVIGGWLECDPLAAGALTLRVKFILVQAGGKLTCGTPEAPFGAGNGATLELVLLPDVSSGVMARLSNRMLIYGELKMYGRPYTSWRRLNHTANAGVTEIAVQGEVNWHAGQRLVLSPSITIGDVEEVSTTSVHQVIGADGRVATVLQFDRPLIFLHMGVTEHYGHRTLEMYSEVGLLSRAITMRTEDPSRPAVVHVPTNMFSGDELGGFKPWLGDLSPTDGMRCDDGEPTAHNTSARTTADKMLFDGDCLALNTSSLASFDDENQTIILQPSSALGLGNVDPGPGYAINIPRRGILSGYLNEAHRTRNDRQMAGVHGAILLDNVALVDVALRSSQDAQVSMLKSMSVVTNQRGACNGLVENPGHCVDGFKPRSSALDLRGGGSSDFFFAHNVVVGPGTASWSAVWATGPVAYTANLIMGGGELWPCFQLRKLGSLYDNVAAGCASTGFEDVPVAHGNNTAHNNLKGVDNGEVAGGVSTLHNFTLWRSAEFAIWHLVEYPYPDQSTVSNVVVADSRDGLLLSHVTGYSPSANIGSFAFLNESLFVGYSRFRQSFGCGTVEGITAVDLQRWPSGVTGVWAPYFGVDSGAAGSGACRACRRKPEGIKTPKGLVKHGEVHVSDVHFVGFNGLCESRSYAVQVNPNCLDNSPPTFFRQVVWSDVPEHHKLYMPPPDPRHINLAGCYTMDCGGFINTLFHDVDGTLTQRGQPASVMARAEDLSPQRSNGQPTPYR